MSIGPSVGGSLAGHFFAWPNALKNGWILEVAVERVVEVEPVLGCKGLLRATWGIGEATAVGPESNAVAVFGPSCVGPLGAGLGWDDVSGGVVWAGGVDGFGADVLIGAVGPSRSGNVASKISQNSPKRN